MYDGVPRQRLERWWMCLIMTMDPFYSDPNAVAMAWEETHCVLETAEAL